MQPLMFNFDFLHSNRFSTHIQLQVCVHLFHMSKLFSYIVLLFHVLKLIFLFIFFLYNPAFSSEVAQRHSAVPFFIPDAFIVTEVNISANQIVCILESSKFSEDTLYLENGERIFCPTYNHPLM